MPRARGEIKEPYREKLQGTGDGLIDSGCGMLEQCCGIRKPECPYGPWATQLA